MDLLDVTNLLHVSRVTSRSKDDSNLSLWVNIVRRNERSSCIIDESGQGDGNFYRKIEC